VLFEARMAEKLQKLTKKGWVLPKFILFCE
jgi:hypothetical protein